MPASTAARGSLASAPTAVDACRAAADALAGAGDIAVEVLLRVGDGLRCVAAVGSWAVYELAAPHAGGMGAALASGESVVDDPVDPDRAAYPVASWVRAVMWVPLPAAETAPVGLLKVELANRGQLTRMRAAAQRVAGMLAARLAELDYSGGQVPEEQLINQALDIAASSDLPTVREKIFRAARDLSGLDTAVGIRKDPDRAPIMRGEEGHPTGLFERMTRLGPDELAGLVEFTHRYGTWFLSGSQRPLAAPPAALAAVGACTVIAIPAALQRLPTPDEIRYVLLVVDERVRPLTPQTMSMVRLLNAQAYIAYERVMMLDSLRAQSKRDPLTGLGHHATFTEQLTHCRPGRTALLMIDIDGFKKINDTRGHAAGDRLLVDLAAELASVMRAQDQVFRVGGDEFVAILDVAGIAQVEQIGRRLVAGARRTGCTISVGGCVQARDEPPEHALRRADHAMYRAKRAGGDRLRLAPVPGRR